jgi:hypothetical protein
MSQHVFRLSLLAGLIVALFAVGSALSDCAHAQTTKCWRNGAQIVCEEQQRYRPGQGYQMPKKTTCWRNGAYLQCETR